MAEAKSDAKFTGQLVEARFKQGEYERTVYVSYPEAGTPFEALLDNGYWAHIARHLRVGDRIEVIPDDNTYFAELIVRASGQNWATVAKLRHVPLDPVSTKVSTEFNIEHRGPRLKFCVVRTKDASVVKDGFATQDVAMSWLSGHIRSLAA